MRTFALLVHNNIPIIGLADGVGCGSEDMTDPPHGHGIIIQGFDYVTGTDTTVQVGVFESTSSSYHSTGGGGTLTLTDINDATVAGSIDMDYTDADDNKMYSAHGDFVIIHCP